MSNEEKGKFHFLIKNRGFFEDIFLYFILLAVISFSSLFLMKTYFDIEKSLPQPNDKQIFLDVLNNESTQTGSNKTESEANSNRTNSEKISKNYLAYLQAQANLNKSRYDLGTRLVLGNMIRKNISFLIGTLLALIGCIVIVRRIRNMTVSAEGNAAGQQVKFLTASPGVLLVLLGSTIILATIIRQDSIDVKDFEPVPPSITAENNKDLDEDTKNEVKDELDDLENKIKPSPKNGKRNE